MTPKRVLVPIDGSPSAQLALELALQLARGAGSEVVIVHSSAEIAELLFEENPYTREEAEELAADALLRAAVNRARDDGVSVRAEVLGEEGTTDIADAIVGVGRGVGADLIVMGSRGRGPLTGKLLGSVSRGVASSADVPVVVVHSPREG